jgi:hypothetical protein
VIAEVREHIIRHPVSCNDYKNATSGHIALGPHRI